MVSKNGNIITDDIKSCKCPLSDANEWENTPKIEEVMDVIDEHLEKLLYAQNILVPALKRASELLQDMNENKRHEVWNKFAEHSQWTAPLDEQLDWVRHNQDIIDDCESELIEEEEVEGLCY